MHLHCFHRHSLPNRYAAGIQILRTGDAFSRLGHRFTVHCPGLSSSRSAILEYYGLPATSDTEFTSLFRVSAQQNVRRLHPVFRANGRGAPIQVILVRGDAAPPLLNFMAMLRALPDGNRPLIVYELHNIQFLRYAERVAGRRLSLDEMVDARAVAMREDERRVIGAADAVVGLTPRVIDAAEAVYGGPLPPHTVLPSGTDWPESVAAVPVPRYDVVYAGKLEERKGVHELIRAMSCLPGRTLVVAGGPAEAADEIRRLATRLGVDSRIMVKGILPPSAVPSFLTQGRVGVCPLKTGIDSVSDRFTSPMKLLEMMSLGMPIVASDIEPVRALVENGKEAHLVPADEPRELAAGIRLLLENPGYSARLGASARRRARSYRWERRARCLESFLENLASRRVETTP